MGRSATDGADGIELPVRVGEVLDGKFRIDHILGIGGMGVVYAATHMQLAQKVAIKLILPSGSKEEVKRLQRLLREARVVAQMKSPHVAHVLDVGTLDSGAPYMVMELLNGVDLDQHLEKHGSVPIDEAIDFILQACEAVAEAHALGVVHRDLKPSNLFLTKAVDKRKMMKVLDFGLSKSVRDERAQNNASITRPLDVIGTPKYMSPEQLRSTRDVDERTDIWSLGIILYELIAGRAPFENDSIPDLCAAVVRDAPPKLMIAGMPDGLEEVIQKCLQKAAKDRYRSITELVEALAPYTTDVKLIESVRRVQRAATIPPELAGDLDFGEITGPRMPAAEHLLRQKHIPTQLIRRRGNDNETDDDLDELLEEAELAHLRRPSFARRLTPALVVLLMLGIGGGTAFLALRMLDEKKGGGGAAAAATTATASPIVATTETVSTPTITPTENAGATGAAGAGVPSSKIAGSSPSQRPLKPGILTRPLTRPATSGGGATTPPTKPAQTSGPTDPDKLLESR